MFMAIPLVDLFVFAIFVGVALWKRRRADDHQRLMLLATVGILTPGIARIPLRVIRRGGLPMFFGLTVGCALPRGRASPPGWSGSRWPDDCVEPRQAHKP
jgi:predicted Kef-type K+ transport protein